MVYTKTYAEKLNKKYHFFGFNFLNYCLNFCAIYYSYETVHVALRHTMHRLKIAFRSIHVNWKY